MPQLTWLGETLQGQMNIMAFPLLGNDNMKNLEVLTVDEQSTPRACCGLFLHAEHQTVKHLRQDKWKTNGPFYDAMASFTMCRWMT